MTTVNGTRGADRAIRSARHRRLAVAVGVLAVVAVLAWVLVGPPGLPGDQSAPPIATPKSPPSMAPGSDPLPAPVTFDAAAFNEAADGWITGWTGGASPVSTEVSCADWDGEYPEPLDTSSTQFRAGTRVGATLKVERFDTTERASDSMMKQSWDESCQGEWVELPDEIWVGGQSLCFGGKLGDQTFYEIYVVHETELAVLRVAGESELPEDSRKKIVLALLADLRT